MPDQALQELGKQGSARCKGATVVLLVAVTGTPAELASCKRSGQCLAEAAQAQLKWLNMLMC